MVNIEGTAVLPSPKDICVKVVLMTYGIRCSIELL